MRFDATYYKDIWQTVHRHDYCDCLADFLIRTYGKCRILDIGTGCGFLVATLKAKGCDAVGIDISDYATQRRCDASVIQADMRALPFADKSFDLITSQGVLGYFFEVDDAIVECQRVGRKQYHNIDFNDTIPEHQYVLIEPQEFWEAKFKAHNFDYVSTA